MFKGYRLWLSAALLTMLICLGPGSALARAATVSGSSGDGCGYATGETATPTPPWIQSDKADYAPASTVTLTSGGWQPGESVSVSVIDDVGQTWQLTQPVVADSTGAFTYQFTLPDRFVAKYDVTAVGTANDVATTTFTDAIGSISPVSGPEGVGFTLTVNRSGGSSYNTSTRIVFGATTLTTTFVNSSQVTAVVPASLLLDEGTVAVTTTNPSGGPTNFTITEGDSLTLTPQGVAATTNASFSGTVATLADSLDNTATGTFAATINWNDGTGTSAGTVTKTGTGTYTITGSHTYASQFWSTSVKTATAYPASTIPIANNGTTNFAASGSLVVFTGSGYQTVTYTGKTTGTSASFTGVTGWTGSGTLAVGNPITQPLAGVGVTVSESSPGTASAATTSPLTVADGMTYVLSAGPFSTTEGQVYTGSSPFFPGSIYTGAVFPSVGNYRLLVSNGTSSAWYTLYTSGPNNYMYPNSTPGSVVFGDEGTVPYTETLYLNNGTPVAAGGDNVTVNDAGLSYFSAVNTYHAAEGASTGSIQVGKFLDSYAGDHHDDFNVTVYWGDGTTGTVPAVYAGSNAYTVSGSHTYAEEGTYTATYDVTDDGGSRLTGISTAIVGVTDPAVALLGVPSIVTTYGTTLGTQDLATFTDPAGAEANDGTHYAATIDWGGSFGTSVGTISYAAGVFTVSGAVPYTAAGSYTATVTVAHEASTLQKVTDTVTINPPAVNYIVPSAGAGGSISPNTAQTVDYGSDSPTFTITPDVGHHIADVLVDGVSQGPITSYQFTSVTAGHTISATFAVDTFDIVPSAGAGGSISPNTAQTVDYGSDSATFTITPDVGHHIADVLVDGVSQGPITSYQFTSVTAGHTISATFAVDTFDVVPTTLGGGSISPSTTQTVDYGADSATFTVAPDTGHHVVDVMVDGVSQGPIAAYQFTNVTAPHSIFAIFAVDTFDIVPSAGAGGSISPNTAQTVDYGSDSATFTITPDVGHHIADVLVDGVSQGPIASYQFTGVTSGHTISATFAVDTFDIVPSAGAGGSISPNTAQTVDYGSDSATFTITPDVGHHTVDVLVDGVSQGPIASYQFTGVTSGHTISARFAVDTFDIVPSAGAGGSISPNTAQTVDYGSDSPTFTITPDVGHHVVDVLVDGVSQGPLAAYQFTGVTAGHTISATFAVSPTPHVTSLSTYAADPGTTVTITGTGFGASEDLNVVTFGGVTTRALTWSDTEITVKVPAGALEGYVGVWRDGVCSNGLFFIPFSPPAVTAISPDAGPVGSTVTISGTGFGASEGVGLVTFGGVTTNAITWSDTTITVAVPAGAPAGYLGVWQNGVCSNGILFTPGTVPVITALSEADAPVGTPVTITGSDFGASQGGGTVTLAGETCAVQSWSDTSITFVVPLDASAGYVGVWNGGISSNGAWLQPVARIDSLSNWWGAPSTEVTITGAGFGSTQGGSRVTFGGVDAAVQSWSDTVITAIVPASASAGYVGVWTNGFCSNGVYFLPVTPAVITGVDPASASVGGTITVTGTGFGASQGAGDSVTVAGVDATVTSWSDTTITAQVPAGAASGYVGVWKSGVSSNGWYLEVRP